ncbi:unnamed protein product [Pelagomonas calceolata]|uniref:Uncharacterized protein n=2 Tax=Pelagomonas calceolata TaxID=35677 RepID=A0A8J2WZD4_9STRA|nr:unnamed protein product [Pelagomonas calceolata]
MSRRRCDCNGPVEASAFGAFVPDLKTLSITLPSLQPLSAAHDWDYWPFGARCEREYYALEASGSLMQMDAYERADLQESMPSICGLDGRQLELVLKQYAGTKAFRYAAARMPDWFRQMCHTGALVPYVAGEEVAHAAARPSPPARRAPAAAPPRRRILRGGTRRPPAAPVPAAVEPDEPDESDKDDKINVRRLTLADYNKPGVSMADKDARLIALLDACREGVFGEELRDCDVRMDCVVARGYPLGVDVKRRRKIFGTDPHADQLLLDAGFVRVGARCPAARADEALERYGPVLRDAAKRGLAFGSSRSAKMTELRKAICWLRERVKNARASDDVVLELAKELGKLAPEDAKGGRWGTEVYWAHYYADQARAVLARANEEDEEEAAEAVSATPRPRPRPRRAASGLAPAVVESSDDEDVATPPTDDYEDEFDAAPAARQTRKRAATNTGDGGDDATTGAPRARRRRDTDVPDASDVKKKIDPTKLTKKDWNRRLPMDQKEEILVACLEAIRAGEIPDVEDCDVRQNCVLSGGYELGMHMKRRRLIWGSDPDADQRLLDAGFVRVSARGNVARADEASELHAPVLRAAAARGDGSYATTEIKDSVTWLGRKVREASRASDVADNVYLELAKELGKLAPKKAKGGRTRRRWFRRSGSGPRRARSRSRSGRGGGARASLYCL